MKHPDFETLNKPVDVSGDFTKLENSFFLASKIVEFDSGLGTGFLECKRHARKIRMCFNQMSIPFEESRAWEFPPEYDQDLRLPLSVSFVSPRTIRLKLLARGGKKDGKPSLMLAKEPETDLSWSTEQTDASTIYRNSFGTVTIKYDPFNIEIRDEKGRLLTKTHNISDVKNLENCEPTPFSVLRRSSDMKRRFAASFSLSQDEKIFGCGESFTRLNKRGQKLVLYATDAFGAQTHEMYKPVPFFISSRGYGMFVHTSAPLTFDFGSAYDGANIIFAGDEQLDLFIFLGSPKEILSEYTGLTGRSPLPPLWSFGLWMSRITYSSEAEVREVAEKLRENQIPCDVIHLDTGWFETDWRCNYTFSSSRFENHVKMIEDLREQGFHISLWQLPYYTPTNELYKEALDKGYAVLDPDGELPVEDAIIDFSNPEAVKWYQELLKKLFDMGVEAIKADFGEAAPLNGIYASGRSGFYEHNLYPLRYNKAVSDVTAKSTGNSIIWGRSAWAGSQRYPLHWGGDSENTDSSMAATLRAGLSLGLCGFSFWSHDIGGFVQKSPEELYRRWLPFGMLTSHSRCHGAPPKEPWEYSDEFMGDFKRAAELKYRLIPYIYSQAKDCSENGLPMLRTIFFEYPDDPTAWFIEDEYFFGSDLLVAPLMEENTTGRKVYLPKGGWIDYQTRLVYEGSGWHDIESGEIPIIMLVRQGAILPHTRLVQRTDQIDWDSIELCKFDAE